MIIGGTNHGIHGFLTRIRNEVSFSPPLVSLSGMEWLSETWQQQRQTLPMRMLPHGQPGGTLPKHM